MLNIEIHGLGLRAVEKTKKRIFKLFENESYYGEITISIFAHPVVDKNGKEQPFIRFFSDGENIKEIMDRLLTLKLNIQCLKCFFLPGQLGDDSNDDDNVKVDKSIIIKLGSTPGEDKL